MVDLELLRRKLERLDEDLANLKRSSKYTQEQFLADPERYGSAERFLQTAIESTIDIASHIISEERMGQIHVYRDIPTIFLESGLIKQDVFQAWIAMIGFRNILVHGYGKIDRSKVYEYLTKNLNDIDVLKKIFLNYL